MHDVGLAGEIKNRQRLFLPSERCRSDRRTAVRPFSWHILVTGGRRRCAGRPPEPVLPYFFFLAVFFLAAFFAFFFVAMVNSFRFWLGKQGSVPWVLHLPAEKSGQWPVFCRLARTGMVHAHHRTAAKTARGAMQGERNGGHEGGGSRIHVS